MWPDQVANPGPLALASDKLPTAQLSEIVKCTNTGDRINRAQLFKASLA